MRKQLQELIYSNRRRIGGGILIGIAFFAFLVSLIVYNVSTSSSQLSPAAANVIINYFSVILSSVLTAVLILLYYKMANITERQVELEEAQNKPQIFIGNIDYRQDTVILELINEGSGLAKAFHIRCDGYIPSDEDGRKKDTFEEMFNYEQHGFTISSTSWPLYRNQNQEMDQNQEKEESISEVMEYYLNRHRSSPEVLRPQNNGFYNPPTFLGWKVSSEEDSPPRSMRFRDVMSLIAETDIDIVCVQITIMFLDINDNLDMWNIDTVSVDVNKEETIEDTIADSSLGPIRRPEPFEEEEILERINPSELN